VQALDQLAGRLEEVAAVLAGGRPDECDPGAVATGPTGGGAPGEVSAALHHQRTAALHARARESASTAAQLGALARDLRAAAAGYADADEAVRVRTAGLEQR
jgi:hypothetical protein